MKQQNTALYLDVAERIVTTVIHSQSCAVSTTITLVHTQESIPRGHNKTETQWKKGREAGEIIFR